MLGEQIGEETGQVTGTRVLPDEGAGPKVEVSFQSSGTTLGVHGSNIGTYISVARPDGTLFGEGQGIATSDEGDVVTWRGQGVGRLTGQAWRRPGARPSIARPRRSGLPGLTASPW